MLYVSHKKERKRSGELVSIKQLDLLSALVKSSGRNQNDQERERGLTGQLFLEKSPTNSSGVYVWVHTSV